MSKFLGLSLLVLLSGCARKPDPALTALEKRMDALERSVRSVEDNNSSMRRSLESMLRVQDGYGQLFDEIQRREERQQEMLESNSKLMRDLMEIETKYGRKK